MTERLGFLRIVLIHRVRLRPISPIVPKCGPVDQIITSCCGSLTGSRRSINWSSRLEDRGVGTDSQRERQHGDDRQHRVCTQERETRISGHTLIRSLKVDTKELIERLGFFRKRGIPPAC